METCDVLIIGAGPAGSTCAGVLAKAGLSVLLLDREEFPRDKPCAGWITPTVLQLLGITPQSYLKECLLQEISEFRTGIMFGREIVTNYGRTVSYAIRRYEFDRYLLQRSGARTLLGEKVTTLEREKDGWLVNGWIRARMVVGAGGHHCPVARALGAVPGREEPIAAMVAELELAAVDIERFRAGSVAISFTPDLSGYAWLLRKGTFLNIGLGSLEGRDVRRQVTAFCAELRRRGVLQEDLSHLFKGHAYLPFRTEGGRTLVADRALLIGDSAGVSCPESGEGILPAVETALMAARTILSSSGDYRKESLAPYAAAVGGRYGRAGGGFAIPPVVKRVAGAVILSSSWLTRKLVLERWFLHTGQPHLDLQRCSAGERQEAKAAARQLDTKSCN